MQTKLANLVKEANQTSQFIEGCKPNKPIYRRMQTKLANLLEDANQTSQFIEGCKPKSNSDKPILFKKYKLNENQCS